MYPTNPCSMYQFRYCLRSSTIRGWRCTFFRAEEFAGLPNFTLPSGVSDISTRIHCREYDRPVSGFKYPSRPDSSLTARRDGLSSLFHICRHTLFVSFLSLMSPLFWQEIHLVPLTKIILFPERNCSLNQQLNNFIFLYYCIIYFDRFYLHSVSRFCIHSLIQENELSNRFQVRGNRMNSTNVSGVRVPAHDADSSCRNRNPCCIPVWRWMRPLDHIAFLVSNNILSGGMISSDRFIKPFGTPKGRWVSPLEIYLTVACIIAYLFRNVKRFTLTGILEFLKEIKNCLLTFPKGYGNMYDMGETGDAL